jgi:threonine aldolase
MYKERVWSQRYDFGNIFAKKLEKTLATLTQITVIIHKNDQNIVFVENCKQYNGKNRPK